MDTAAQEATKAGPRRRQVRLGAAVGGVLLWMVFVAGPCTHGLTHTNEVDCDSAGRAGGACVTGVEEAADGGAIAQIVLSVVAVIVLVMVHRRDGRLGWAVLAVVVVSVLIAWVAFAFAVRAVDAQY